jgi:hypothetical protein
MKYFKSLSFYTVIFTLSLLTWIIFNNQRWNDIQIIRSDVVNYYEYLPATFIRHDLALKFMEANKVSDGEIYWFQKSENGGRVIKTTMGMAILYSPFFYIAHTYTQQGEEIANGFTYHYQKAIFLSALFYIIFGLFFLRLLLLKFYNELISSIVIVMIVFGTNLYNYITLEAAMPHAYNFTLIAIFLYHTVIWHEKQKLKYAIIIGITGGLIVLIRPINILIFLFPVLLNVCNMKDIKTKADFFWQHRYHIILVTVLIFMCCLPQLLYWKYITGSFLFNSYVGERFYFENPHVLEGLFSYRKGWLVYSPFMFFALIGMYSLFKEKRQLFLPVFIFNIIAIYIIFSWWAWWYGGGFGARPLIDFYALYALSIGALLQQVYDKKLLLLSHILVPVFLFLIYLNLLQSKQYKYCSIHYDSMTKNAYWFHFMKIDCIDWPPFEKELKAPDYYKALNGKDEYEFNPF